MAFCRYFVVIICATFLLFPSRSLAGLYCPSSHAILSDDKQYLLVMRSSIRLDLDEGHIFRLPSGQDVDLRSDFHTNGVYRLDTRACVLPLDWYADPGELCASGDLQTLIRLNRFAVESQKKTNWNWCLRFYKGGQVIKQYQLRDLVQIPSVYLLPYATWGWYSVWYEKAMFPNSRDASDFRVSPSSNNHFVLVTAPQCFRDFEISGGNAFLFNAQTGEIEQQWRHYPKVTLGFILMGMLAVFLLPGWLLFRFIRKRIRARPKPPQTPSGRLGN